MRNRNGDKFALAKPTMRTFIIVLSALLTTAAFAEETAVIVNHEVVTERVGTMKTVTIIGYDAKGNARVNVHTVSTFTEPRGAVAPSYSLGVRAVEGREFYATTLSNEEFQKLSTEILAVNDRKTGGVKCKTTIVFYAAAMVKSSALDCPAQ